MDATLLPHAREDGGVRHFPAAVLRVLQEPDEEGEANMGRLYAQKDIGSRRIRVIYNQAASGPVVVTVMLRRREGGGP
jgi:hypothetical protein